MDITTRDELCCGIINQYLFDNVWNEPVSEYRINIHPQPIKLQSVSGSFQTTDSSIILPTTNEPYYVWYIKASDLSLGLELDSCKWYDSVSVCNDFNTLIHAYLTTGEIMPKHAVFFRYNYSRTIIFIAIKKVAFNLQSNASKINNLHLTVYYDSDRENTARVFSIYVDSRNNIRALQRQLDLFLAGIEDDTQLLVFKDCIEITNGIIPITDVGVWYDYIIDKNIVATVDIEIGNTNEDPVFLSTRDRVWKQLIHIPKAVNPDNNVYTHNTCDVFIRNKDSETTYGKYLHRVSSTGRAVSQVTHNDMAIPLFMIDAFRDYLNTQNVSVHLVIRKHDKNNVLIPNKEYIDLLYCDAHTDQDIINILTGKGPEYLPFWQAANLEQSAYVNMMFNVPDCPVSTANITEYIDALGYYNTVNLLCKHIIDTTVTDGYTGVLNYPLPLLFLGMTCVPIIYINGKMLPMRYYSYQTLPDTNICKVTISSSIYVRPGDTITALLHLTENNNVYLFTPEANNLTCNITYSTPQVYQILDVDLIRSINRTTTNSYKQCGRYANIYTTVARTDGTTDVTFNDQYIGKTFIISNSNASYVKTYDLAEYTDTGKTIAIPMRVEVTDTTGTTVPILGNRSISVYLNRDYLVEGIDYTINKLYDEEGNLAISEVVIQTMDSFNPDGPDLLTILYSVAAIDDSSAGFSIDDKLYDDTPVNLVYDRLTTVHVDGTLAREYTDYKTYTKLPEGIYRQGSVFEIRTTVPKVVHEFLNSYTKSDDTARIAALNRYFAAKKPVDPDVLVLENKHRIYSVFMNNFINDLISGRLTVVYDPDLERMADYIRPYLYLKNMDICYKDNDQRFVDYYPQYINYEVDTKLKKVIDLFIKIYMPKNIDPTMEVVYE